MFFLWFVRIKVKQVPMQPIEAFIDANVPISEAQKLTSYTERWNWSKAKKDMAKKGIDPTRAHCVVNVSGSSMHYNVGYSPCLTRSRASGGGHYLSWLDRKMTLAEVCRLQGVYLTPQLVASASQRQLMQIAGNAICVDVLAPLMRNLMAATNINPL